MPDATTRWSLKSAAYTDDDHTPIEMEAIGSSDPDESVKEIVIAGVLASLSIAVAPLGAIVPRVPGWGIAVLSA